MNFIFPKQCLFLSLFILGMVPAQAMRIDLLEIHTIADQVQGGSHRGLVVIPGRYFEVPGETITVGDFGICPECTVALGRAISDACDLHLQHEVFVDISVKSVFKYHQECSALQRELVGYKKPAERRLVSVRLVEEDGFSEEIMAHGKAVVGNMFSFAQSLEKPVVPVPAMVVDNDDAKEAVNAESKRLREPKRKHSLDDQDGKRPHHDGAGGHDHHKADCRLS